MLSSSRRAQDYQENDPCLDIEGGAPLQLVSRSQDPTHQWEAHILWKSHDYWNDITCIAS